MSATPFVFRCVHCEDDVTVPVDKAGKLVRCPGCKQIVKAVAADPVAPDVLVTTTPQVDGYTVARYIGIESVEFVIGTGAFSEVTSSLADFFGARSSAFEKKLQAAKRHAMDAMKFVAAEQGANAVIGVDLDYAEFSGNRVALIISGTLVQLVPDPPRRPGTPGR